MYATTLLKVALAPEPTAVAKQSFIPGTVDHALTHFGSILTCRLYLEDMVEGAAADALVEGFRFRVFSVLLFEAWWR